ncbi:PREDICTED: bolA-like protein 2 [Priapulus caudatus]|uniref:BolA-like protein 2 n=1 Tax=Priapulus caudatus TaxID=37621 RepID=A0ABM1FC24_PRICU|nr:PREDICTED: bolA-like protein 2 [Priapulus caudatus]
MSITADSLKDKLSKELEPTYINVEDTSPNHCGAAFELVIVSNKFEGKPLLQRHRLVNTCLAEELKTIHAFSQKTYTPEQWQKQQSA